MKSETVPELESVELGLFEDPESELRSELANSEKLEPESKSARFESVLFGELESRHWSWARKEIRLQFEP